MKKLNKFVAVLVALAMMATLCVMSAFAANPTAETTGVWVTKTLQIPQGLSTVAETFTFTGTLNTIDDNAATNDQKNALKLTDATISFDAGETDSDGDGYIRKKGKLTLPANTAWPHAGVYVYTLAETAGSTPGMDYADETYTVSVYVKNGSTPGTYEVSDVVVENATEKVDADEPGEDPNGEPNQTGETDASGANFTNTYTKIADDTDTDDPVDPQNPEGPKQQASFVVGKTVDGEHGDKTKQFKYTMTIDYSKTYVTSPTITVTKDGNTITPAEGVYSFTLADGEEIVVEGAPVGTLYTVTENLENDDAAALNYTGAVAVMEDGVASTSKSKAMPAAKDDTEGKNVVVTNALVGDAASYAEYTNKNFDAETTPTGILINNLPYIVLALVAIGGLCAYVIVRRKADDEA